MPCWRALERVGLLLLLLIGIVACGEAPGRLDIRDARLDAGGARVVLDLDLQLTSTHLEALDHGVPLRLDFIVAPIAGAGTIESIVLGFSPLTHRYELTSSQEETPRQFDTRAQMLASLDRVSMPVRVGNDRGVVRGRLNIDALPPALRMTARFDRRWHLETQTREWHR